MAIYDRDYIFRNSPPRRGPRLGSFNTILIIVNIAIFVLGALSPKLRELSLEYGYFSTFRVTWVGGLQFWRFITYQFLHANFAHVFFNMLGLLVFGPLVEQHLGSKRYFALYLTCGVFGGVSYLILNALGMAAAQMGFNHIPMLLYNSGPGIGSSDVPLIGASAGVFGVIVAAAVIAPNLTVQLLFPPVPMRLKVLAMVYVGIAFFNVVVQGKNAGGDAAHIGGAIAGYFLIRNAHLLRDFFDVFTDSRRQKSRERQQQARPAAPRARTERDDDAEVDRILDKVRQHGTQSLTSAERETLAKATRSRGGV
ncbi:MAG: rhomboid family intramembrane serine protease [Tepidisphaera sp.]|nr:rhomboid family intramembrane serine protease [Tepidisphaera sp.]